MANHAPRELSVTPTPSLVWGRALLLGSVGLATGVLSHALGDGRLPGAGSLTALWVVCVLGSAAFLLGRASSLRLILLVLGAQTGVHTALSALAGHRGDGALDAAPAPVVTGSTTGWTTGSTTGRPERFHDQYEALVATLPAGRGDDWLAHQIDHFTAQGPGMVLAHLGGAIALGLFLAVGERALWRLLLLVAARTRVRLCAWQLLLASACARRGVALRAGLLRAPGTPVLTPALLDRRVLSHRGPPMALAA
ncbi:hypothetical protein [Nocardioides gilvus]|uniref:hypothetical protein n=1 Tax=Nocardioides gilvus TaxID=1735589 RepID=UPI0013A5B153|nr:hypothetical protein [Nocardioides gilvus]